MRGEAILDWEKENEWERSWWGDCLNTYGEEMKQYTYARKMGLIWIPGGDRRTNGVIDLEGKAVMDIGGGPVSLLLKCVNRGRCFVVDPCGYPAWTEERYRFAGIDLLACKGEDLEHHLPGVVPDFIPIFDEAWLYNVLQHTEDPAKVVRNARKIAKVVRAFEPIGTRISNGHPHSFDGPWLDRHFGGEGKVEHIKENTMDGVVWYGIFNGDRYEEI